MRAWVEIDINKLKQNIRNIRKCLNKKTLFMGIIKADGYGHGAVQIAQALKDEGVSRFGVASADEGIILRENGFNEEILILGYTAAEDYPKVIENGMTATLYTQEQGVALNREAANRKRKVKIHIKIDTGMGRLGFKCDNAAVDEIKKISDLKQIEIEGIFSHLATADDKENLMAYQQFRRFMQFVNTLESKELRIPIKHIANSAASLNYPEMHLNMARIGIALYGLFPSIKMATERTISLTPIMSIKAKLAQVKWVERESCLGYGAEYRVNQRMKIGTVPVGYADGISRIMSDKGYVLVHGRKCPITGNICMDQFMVDLAESDNGKEGDEVVIMGRSGSNEIRADDMAVLASTISYEIVTRIGRRLPRIYKNR